MFYFIVTSLFEIVIHKDNMVYSILIAPFGIL